MRTCIEKLHTLSYKTVAMIGVGLTLLSILPVLLYVTQQQTRTVSQATAPTPTEMISSVPTSGPIPDQPPLITRVYPWVGKVGDAIVIEGAHFGNFPQNHTLTIAGQPVSDEAITSWEDTQIITSIPPNSQQGGVAAVRISSYPTAISQALALYDETATIQLTQQDSTVTAIGLTEPVTVILVTSSDKGKSLNTEKLTISPSSSDQTPLFSLKDNEEILSLLLQNDAGIILPYSLNPTDFGF